MNTTLVDPRQPSAFGGADRRHELARVLRRKRRLRAGVVQLLGAVVAIGLAFLVPQIPIGFDISTSRAIEMLITVAAATVTFIGIVYSLLFLVVQFGSTTFTPRLNLFRDDPVVWRTFAFYTAVVIYSLTASLVIGQDENTSGAVPIVAFVAVLTSIALYRRLTTGAFNSIQLASALAQVARRGREVIDGLYILDASAGDVQDAPARASAASPAGTPSQEIRWPRASAVLQVIDVPRVLRAAEQANAEVDFKLGSGELVAEGAIVAVATGQTDPELEHVVVNALTVGEERTYEQDPLFAIRVLADIALRALSPAVNDPTTAVQALDAMDGLLRALATRELDVGRIADRDGTLRITLVLPTWEDYLAVALDEIIALREVSPNVSRRILRLLDELEAITPAGRHPALAARRRQIQDANGKARSTAPPDDRQSESAATASSPEALASKNADTRA
jgi:uncharacterized membrane protein